MALVESTPRVNLGAALQDLRLGGAGWTDDRVLGLRLCWREGLSASQIAKRLGGVTRNAVIGKIHRLGLARRATPSRPAKRPARAERPLGPSPPRLRTSPPSPPATGPALAPLVFEDGRTASILTLAEGMCKYPIGDPLEEGFAFCARGVSAVMRAEGVCYCDDHARLCYQRDPDARAARRKKRLASADPHMALLRQLERSMAPVRRGFMRQGHS